MDVNPQLPESLTVTSVPKGGPLSSKGGPSIFVTDRNFLMRFSLHGRSSKLDFNDVQLVTVSGNQDGGHIPEAGMKNLGLSFYTR